MANKSSLSKEQATLILRGGKHLIKQQFTHLSQHQADKLALALRFTGSCHLAAAFHLNI